MYKLDLRRNLLDTANSYSLFEVGWNQHLGADFRLDLLRKLMKSGEEFHHVDWQMTAISKSRAVSF